MPLLSRSLLLSSLFVGSTALALERGQGQGGNDQAILVAKGPGLGLLEQGEGVLKKGKAYQTPEELGFTPDGEVAMDGDKADHGSHFSEDSCLDLGAKGFPLPVFDMLQEVNWDAGTYFETLVSKGFAEDALQMTGPRDAFLSTDCMKENFRGKTKHIFVGDSQMMALRNAFHRRTRCPEIWYTNSSQDQAMREGHKTGVKLLGRLHSASEQSPQATLPKGCTEEGIASYIFWDAWAKAEVPVAEIKHEMDLNSLDPRQGDTVVVWIGSNFIPAGRRLSLLRDTTDQLHSLGVRMVWDSPTYQDAALIAATSRHSAGRDSYNEIPIVFTEVTQRKRRGELGSNEYRSEKAFLQVEENDIPMTKRWQLTNRYRGLQCDGMHTDMRARDPLFYKAPCPAGEQGYGTSVYCSWVEPFDATVEGRCPAAAGLDDLVLQSGLYAMCAAHENPFCYQHTDDIR